MNKADENAVSQNKLVLRPLIGLMRGQAPEEIEHFVIDEIKKHRRLRDDAVRLEKSLEEAKECTQLDARRAYITAMIAVHAQQTVVSTLLDILGYIPNGAEESVH
ncbi:transcriptional repressor TraM [Rhizobium sp. BT-226]|uniref:transcriptional repressor TraM n=1 Tax=Rhizobium sp. BT-226 TaxID=2986922 RepID=UPI0021F6E362|nr:transcriptional repressor TraM [Rhizobium sp. BT-226]MCW0021324.1 transcriptional repressor TraM [Rhizobium sp. BT-226]